MPTPLLFRCTCLLLCLTAVPVAHAGRGGARKGGAFAPHAERFWAHFRTAVTSGERFSYPGGVGVILSSDGRSLTLRRNWRGLYLQEQISTGGRVRHFVSEGGARREIGARRMRALLRKLPAPAYDPATAGEVAEFVADLRRGAQEAVRTFMTAGIPAAASASAQ